MTSPAISVIMAAYNGAAVIGDTIASLQAQTFDDFEVVIVDDCSTDATLSLLQSIDDPRIRLFAAPKNRGPVCARNAAFAEARGRYIAGLDQDDLCEPDRLGAQLRYLDAHPDTVLVGTAATIFDDQTTRPSLLPAVMPPALVEWLLDIMNPLVWSSVMIRGDAARQLDPFTRPERVYAEDFDLYHRLRRFGRIARIDQELLRYRSHDDQVSKRFVETMYASATRVLADRHQATLGDDAGRRCALIVRHIMGQEPVADRASLSLLGDTIMRLQQQCFATETISRDDRKLIRWETARIWGRIGRVSLRSGTLGLADTVAVRPDHLGMGYSGLDALAVSKVIGGMRGLIKRRG